LIEPCIFPGVGSRANNNKLYIINIARNTKPQIVCKTKLSFLVKRIAVSVCRIVSPSRLEAPYP
jgi:hypothetical protein